MQNMITDMLRDFETWGQLQYYEFDEKVGDTFYIMEPAVTIDGYCVTDSLSRFSVGALSNVKRNSSSMEARKKIGRGIYLTYSGDGNNKGVGVQCLGDLPIFVCSAARNQEIGWAVDQVGQLGSCSPSLVFSDDYFQRIVLQNAGNQQKLMGFVDMCFIRIGLGEGWGSAFPSKNVYETPCWVELRLNCSLNFLDRILCQCNANNVSEQQFTAPGAEPHQQNFIAPQPQFTPCRMQLQLFQHPPGFIPLQQQLAPCRMHSSPQSVAGLQPHYGSNHTVNWH